MLNLCTRKLVRSSTQAFIVAVVSSYLLLFRLFIFFFDCEPWAEVVLLTLLFIRVVQAGRKSVINEPMDVTPSQKLFLNKRFTINALCEMTPLLNILGM